MLVETYLEGSWFNNKGKCPFEPNPCGNCFFDILDAYMGDAVLRPTPPKVSQHLLVHLNYNVHFLILARVTNANLSHSTMLMYNI